MADGVELLLVPGVQGRFPLNALSPEEVEMLANEDFASRNMHVVPGFFQDIINLEFLLNGQQSDERLVGSSTVLNDSVDGFNFLYVTKANVAVSYHGNGLLNQMVEGIARIAEDKKIPVVLRTSSPRVRRKYSKSHDIYTLIEDYSIHGFGFQQKGTKNENFQRARELFANSIAPYVAAKPQTVVPKQGRTAIVDEISGPMDYEHEMEHMMDIHHFARRESPFYVEPRGGRYLNPSDPVSRKAHPAAMARYLQAYKSLVMLQHTRIA
jgi:hypothetical protein